MRQRIWPGSKGRGVGVGRDLNPSTRALVSRTALGVKRSGLPKRTRHTPGRTSATAGFAHRAELDSSLARVSAGRTSAPSECAIDGVIARITEKKRRDRLRSVTVVDSNFMCIV